MSETTTGNTGITTKVVTGICRLAFAAVWEPKSFDGNPEKYSCSLIIPKADAKTLALINAACKAAFEAGKSKLGDKVRYETLKKPLRDGDTERPDDEAYQNTMFMNASAKDAPGIIDLAKNKITDQAQVYSGCYVRASLNFYAFNQKGNRGIACGLNHLQKVRDGIPFGGRGRAELDFDDNFTDSDDFLT